MSEEYVPPFTMTDEITNLVIEIAELTGAITASDHLSRNPRLRRENRVRSIHSSLAIEQNSLTLDQVSDVIDGKRVLGPPQDIREVKNAYQAYELLAELNPYSIKDLLKAHKIMMDGLVEKAGTFRSKGVGVFAGEQLIHAGSPANYVPELMQQLFDWLRRSKLHPLIKSCLFHYEFEFIHPFADGNGRTGRLWHTLILAKWKEFFLWIPIESMIHERQQEYYNAINASNNAGESTIFVTLMLGLIRDILKELAGDSVMEDHSTTEEKVIGLIKKHGKLSAAKMAEQLGLSTRQVQRILRKLKDQGMIEHVGTNRNGQYIAR